MDDFVKLMILRKILIESSSDETTESVLDVGLRVVRGPDWKWDNQDNGEGHLGTVIKVEKLEKWVDVWWDSGTGHCYRIGHNNAYDIRTLDNSSLGVKHPSTTCDSCLKKGILGMRWKCKQCYDYDLCTQCYMSDRHDITHAFFRIQTVDSPRVEVPKRQGAVKLPMKGIFASAKVVRGRDWEWGNQDGGPGKTGLVTSICGWGDDSDRNTANVTWSADGSSNRYRIGRSGKVDLKCIDDAVDGYYYRDHLPILGDETRTIRAEDSENMTMKEAETNKDIGSTSKTTEDNNKTTIIETGSSEGLTCLSQNLKEFFFSNQFYDLTIKVQDRKFQVHKAILCARSSVFASKLQSALTTLEISDCDPDTFEDVIFYLYTGKIKQISCSNVTNLYEAAIKYNIQSLKDECIQFKKEGLSLDYICDCIAVA